MSQQLRVRTLTDSNDDRAEDRKESQGQDEADSPQSADVADLVVVANRLPFQRSATNEGWIPSPGGLVTAMRAVLENLDGSTAWIGWDGLTSEETTAEFGPSSTDRLTAVPLALTQELIDGFYDGFANGTLWPLYHDAIRRPAFDATAWSAYVEANQRFAQAAARWTALGGTVWVHDYHLQLVPALLRELRPDIRIGFFLHIPFPPPELFAQLPWRNEILRGLLGADLIGFQEPAAVRNFGFLVRRFNLATGDLPTISYGGRAVHVGSFPVSIAGDYGDSVRSEPVRAAAAEFRARLQHPRTIFLGVDRLDYTKGIEARLEAFRRLLTEDDLDAREAVLVQVAVPSREDVDFYQREREHVERLVSDINGQHSELGSPVIHYLYRSMEQAELLALYAACDVALVTPYRDGMNLVAKEYVASRVDDDGVLILSEFTGAARELRDAILVNPHDGAELVAALRTARTMVPEEQARRMRQLRKAVKSWTAADWATAFLTQLAKRV